jgi:hypothetical protein
VVLIKKLFDYVQLSAERAVLQTNVTGKDCRGDAA